MIIGLDYDYTYTANPDFWQDVIAAGKRHGVQFVIATNRTENMPVGPVGGSPVVYCSGRPKKRACRDRGWEVSIWIDDMPWLVHFGNVGEPPT